jgi:hypothetical protein
MDFLLKIIKSFYIDLEKDGGVPLNYKKLLIIFGKQISLIQIAKNFFSVY